MLLCLSSHYLVCKLCIHYIMTDSDEEKLYFRLEKTHLNMSI